MKIIRQLPMTALMPVYSTAYLNAYSAHDAAI
jgi:hypothetical protein